MSKLKRLREMSAREIAYRAWEKARMQRDRVLRPKPRSSQIPQIDGARFYFPARGESRESLRNFIACRFPQFVDSAIQGAERVRQHRVELLGLGEVELGAAINWHRDPVGGREWPRRFWADYDPVHDWSAGDVKVIHELNRQQHLPVLGKAYFLSGEEAYATEAIAQIESWIEQNPLSVGINWQSCLEVAIRAISWLWTIHFLLESDSYRRRASQILPVLAAHFRHIDQYPSIYSSPNTHIIGEAAALFIGGVALGVERWRSRGAALLELEISRQVFADGVHGELSSYYHCYALDFYLQAFLLALRVGIQFSIELSQKLQAMLEYLAWLARADGTIPLLGDDDGGRALPLGPHTYRNGRAAIAIGAALFRNAHWKHVAGEFSEEALWLMGEAGWCAFESVPAAPPLETCRAFPSAGYFIHRTGWDRKASGLVFDAGGLGIQSGGHAHADALSFVLDSNGQELLVDPGTCVYNNAPEWRRYFRSTAAHNTVTIAGASQSEPGDTFNWAYRARTRTGRCYGNGSIEYVEGEHDGYTRLPGGVVHCRRVLFCKPAYWAIVDEFYGQGGHEFDSYYHFAPELNVSLTTASRTMLEAIGCGRGAGVLLSLHTPVPVVGEIATGSASKAYGSRKPAAVLRATYRASAPVSTISLLRPFHSQEDPRKKFWVQGMEIASGEALACSMEHGEHTDFLILPYADQIAFRGSLLSGELFWLRMRGGALRELFAVGARSFSFKGNTVFDQAVPLPFVSARFDRDKVLLRCGEAGDDVLCAEFAGL